MAKYVYPAVFTPEKKGYSVVFPDIESCYTCGDSMESALEMAQDILALRLCDMENASEKIPDSSCVQDILCEKGETVFLIECDTGEYRCRNDKER